MNWFRAYLILSPLLFGIGACEKEIKVDLPEGEIKYVVEGRIESGKPPLLILTKTSNFFDPTDIISLENSFVHDAQITVSNGTETIVLREICSNEIPKDLLYEAVELTDLAPSTFTKINFCAYVGPDLNFVGEMGKTYQLEIKIKGHTLRASSTLPQVQHLEKLWFKERTEEDTFGYVWNTLNDPGNEENFYRWWSKRLNTRLNGYPRDYTYSSPEGGIFNDVLFNGLEYSFRLNRGMSSGPGQGGNLNNESGFTNEEWGFFKLGDTISVKFQSMGENEFKYLKAFESAIDNNGNPFTSPGNIPGNIEGGLGLWGAYGISYDTVIAEID